MRYLRYLFLFVLLIGIGILSIKLYTDDSFMTVKRVNDKVSATSNKNSDKKKNNNIKVIDNKTNEEKKEEVVEEKKEEVVEEKKEEVVEENKEEIVEEKKEEVKNDEVPQEQNLICEVCEIEIDNSIYEEVINNEVVNDSTISNFMLKRNSVTLGDYNENINSYRIEIVDDNGEVIDNSNFSFKSSNEGIASVSDDGEVVAKFGGISEVSVFPKGDEENKKVLTVNVIHSLYTLVEIIEDVRGTSIVTGEEVNLEAGTKGIYNGVGIDGELNGSLSGNIIKVNDDYISLDNSYVKVISYYISDLNGNDITENDNLDNKYSNEVAEEFVNTFNFTSDTEYLFWINQGTQTCYIFNRNNNSWILMKTFMVNTTDSAKILSNKSSSGGVHFDYKIGDVSDKKLYNNLPFIYKINSNNEKVGKLVAKGTGKLYPASKSATYFKKNKLKYLISNIDKFKDSSLIEY